MFDLEGVLKNVCGDVALMNTITRGNVESARKLKEAKRARAAEVDAHELTPPFNKIEVSESTDAEDDSTIQNTKPSARGEARPDKRVARAR